MLTDLDGKKGTDTPSTNSVPASPGPVVNQLDDSARETFPTGRPLEDTPELQQCKICKKSVLKTAIAAHVEACVKSKNEKLRKKKEQKEAREREKKLAAKGDEKDKDEEGDTRMEDDDEDEDVAADKKGPGGLKSTKKSAGKKIEVDDNKKGKKRKADGDAEKGPKQKKKKEEPKPKAPKQKGILNFLLSCCHLCVVWKFHGVVVAFALSISSNDRSSLAEEARSLALLLIYHHLSLLFGIFFGILWF